MHSGWIWGLAFDSSQCVCASFERLTPWGFNMKTRDSCSECKKEIGRTARGDDDSLSSCFCCDDQMMGWPVAAGEAREWTDCR